MAIPKLDTALVPFITNFNQRIAAAPGDFSLSTSDATQLTNLVDVYLPAQAAVVAAAESGSRSKALTATRDQARTDLLAWARALYAQVQKATDVTVANKELLGITVLSSNQTPQPAPQVAPQMVIESVVGREISGRLCPGAKPEYAFNATVLSFIGAVAPDETGAWKNEGQTGKTKFSVTLPASVEPGTTVWLTAYWTNRKGESSYACTPISWTFGAAGVENNGTLKMAA